MVVNLAELFGATTPEAMAGVGHLADHMKRIEALIQQLIQSLPR